MIEIGWIVLGWFGTFICWLGIIFLCVWLYGFLARPAFIPYQVRYFPIRILAPFVCFICGLDIEVIGREHLPNTKGKRGYEIVANHQSMFDPVVMATIIKDPLSFVAKKSISYVPFVGTWARTIRAPFIDRKNLRQSYGAVMIEGSNNIKKGMAMAIFPAGTRSRSNEVLDFKAGSFKMGTSVGAPILPITLENVYRAAKGNFFKRTKVKVYIHPLIKKAEYEKLTSFELAKKAQSIITEPIKGSQEKGEFN